MGIWSALQDCDTYTL